MQVKNIETIMLIRTELRKSIDYFVSESNSIFEKFKDEGEVAKRICTKKVSGFASENLIRFEAMASSLAPTDYKKTLGEFSGALKSSLEKASEMKDSRSALGKLDEGMLKAIEIMDAANLSALYRR